MAELVTVYGADVSHFQTSLQVADACKGGARFIIAKATDGARGVDTSHGLHVATARAGHVGVGHYHFARTCAAWAAEADHFLATAMPAVGDAVAVDLENMDGDWEQRVTYACGWLEHIHDATRAEAIWYTNESWHAAFVNAATIAQRQYLGTFPWWVATAGKPAGQPGVNGWSIHQYSTAGHIDHDVLAAGVTWAQLAIPAPGTDTPPAHSEEDDNVTTYVERTTGQKNPDGTAGTPGIYRIEGGKIVGLTGTYAQANGIAGVPPCDDVQWARFVKAYGPPAL